MQMQEAVLVYFQGEKSAGIVLLCIGIASLVSAVIFYQPRYALRSFAITLAVFAFLEIAIGAGLYLRTDPQVGRLIQQLQSDSAGFYRDEQARMERVQRNFVVIQYIEVAVILISAAAALLLKNRMVLSGVALAFLIHAVILLAFDIVAERRGGVYLAEIQSRQARPAE
jgi:hypothetical protein